MNVTYNNFIWISLSSVTSLKISNNVCVCMYVHVGGRACVRAYPAGATECPDDWTVFQGSCYVFIDDFVGWTDAWVRQYFVT